jgi:hypothetical protein
MWITISLSILVIIISFCARYKRAEFALPLSFLIIFIFTAIRFNYGTDYPGYYRMFNSITSFSKIFTTYYKAFEVEKGWLILCYIFKPIGFFGMIFILSGFTCYTYYSLIKKYVSVNYYWLAVLIYVFSFEIMLIQFSAIRQTVSIAIFLNAIKYLYEKRSILKYILLILLAGTIHSSAYFLIIFVVFAFEKIQKSNIVGYIILIIFFLLLFDGHDIKHVLSSLSNLFFGDRYAERFATNVPTRNTLIGSIFWSLLLIIIIYFSRAQPLNFKYLFYFYSFYFMTYVLSNLIFLADRLGYYFAPFCIIVLPQIVSTEKNRIVKYGILALFLLLMFYRYYHMFSFDFMINGYSKYHTIFSTLF